MGVKVIEGFLGKSVSIKIYGEEANILAKQVFGRRVKDGDETDKNTKVWFRVKSVEGRLVVEMEVAI